MVEDEEDIQELVAYNLRNEGFQVACALSARRASTLARRKRPDLVVLDLMLPGVDGLEVCRRLRAEEETRAVAVVMLTAKQSDIVVGLELGADDYITKPLARGCCSPGFAPCCAASRRSQRSFRRPTGSFESTTSKLIRGGAPFSSGAILWT